MPTTLVAWVWFGNHTLHRNVSFTEGLLFIGFAVYRGFAIYRGVAVYKGFVEDLLLIKLQRVYCLQRGCWSEEVLLAAANFPLWCEFLCVDRVKSCVCVSGPMCVWQSLALPLNNLHMHANHTPQG